MNPAQRRLIIVTGGEGAGKSTVMSALLPQTAGAAKIDAEDIGQVNPFIFDQPFLELLWNNTTALVTNFWAAGYSTVITGSFLDGDTHASFRQFRARLPRNVVIYLVHLQASKPVRDQRRIDRAKPSTAEWRDRVDASYPDDETSLRAGDRGYRYIPIVNSDQNLHETIAAIKAAIPEIYGESPTSGDAAQQVP